MHAIQRIYNFSSYFSNHCAKEKRPKFYVVPNRDLIEIMIHMCTDIRKAKFRTDYIEMAISNASNTGDLSRIKEILNDTKYYLYGLRIVPEPYLVKF